VSDDRHKPVLVDVDGDARGLANQWYVRGLDAEQYNNLVKHVLMLQVMEQHAGHAGMV
jgi:hypothetical protein